MDEQVDGPATHEGIEQWTYPDSVTPAEALDDCMDSEPAPARIIIDPDLTVWPRYPEYWAVWGGSSAELHQFEWRSDGHLRPTSG